MAKKASPVTDPEHAKHAHVALLYEDDDVLSEQVVDFLFDGWTPKEPLIVVATPARREAISRAISLVKRWGEAKVVMLDAQDTLDLFMRDGMPDPELVEKHVGGVLATVCRGSTRARAYGEMVDVLSRAGQHEAAVRLEELWNDLATKYPFSLHCGYHRGNLFRAGNGLVGKVRALHTDFLNL